MRIGLVIYGDLSTVSGGYLYDRMLVHHLRTAGDELDIISIPWRNYPRHLTDNASRDLFHRHFPDHARYDIVLQDELNHPSLFLLNYKMRRSDHEVPLISVVHHLRSDEDHPAYARLLYRTIERAYLRSVDGFIFNSNTTRARVLSHRRDEAPGIVAFPAADHLAPPPEPSVIAAIEERRATGGPLRLLFVGNVIRRKGLHTVLDALAQNARGNVHLNVAGSLESEPAYATEIKRSIGVLGLQDQVSLRGRVDTAMLRGLFSESDVLVVPSYEGFGIVYLEAMSYGLPVIATTAGAAHEVVQHAHNGFLTAPGDARAVGEAITTLANDRNILARMGAAARARFDAHPTWRETFSGVRDWLRHYATRGH